MDQPRVVHVSRGLETHHITVPQLTASRLAQLFNLDLSTVYLKELGGQFVSRFPNSDGVFMLSETEDYEVEGRFSITTEVQPSVQNQIQATPTGRPPAPIAMAVPGAPLVGIPPPGSRNARSRRSAPVQQNASAIETVTLNIYHAIERNRKSRPVPKERWALTITRDEANVPTINRKLKEIIGEELVISDAEGVKIADCPATREPKQWGFDTGCLLNAKKFYAMPVEIDNDEGASRDVDQPSRKVLKKMEQVLEHTFEKERAVASSAKNTFQCTICRDTMTQPAICLSCKALVGCEDCCISWMASNNENSNACPLCRANWENENGAYLVMSSVAEFLQNIK